MKYRWHICSFTTIADVTLMVGARQFRFEWSNQFGPLMLGKRGEPLSTTLPERSPFWRALRFWIAQGKQVVNGIGQYEERTRTNAWLQLGPRTLVQATPEHRAKWPEAVVVAITEDDFSPSVRPSASATEAGK